jgi:hypothetical protein
MILYQILGNNYRFCIQLLYERHNKNECVTFKLCTILYNNNIKHVLQSDNKKCIPGNVN